MSHYPAYLHRGLGVPQKVPYLHEVEDEVRSLRAFDDPDERLRHGAAALVKILQLAEHLGVLGHQVREACGLDGGT